MKLAFIGTYPPRECGIGIFTNNLFNSILANSEKGESGDEGFVVALNDNGLDYEYPKEVKVIIRQDQQEDYLKAVKFINLSGADICILEHEFGIFGGQNGVQILPLLHRLKVP
ncbi:MAG: glycosyl transferase, partial [Bacteroidales bacterium]|nr:glycosyl transferase [Bacteroidales bacterium]